MEKLLRAPRRMLPMILESLRPTGTSPTSAVSANRTIKRISRGKFFELCLKKKRKYEAK
jgi:hypothetical protein